METGERIQKRRMELGMTQDDLAIAIGYKSRSSINKIEKGDRKIPQSLILSMADALLTTPGYILGRDEVPNKDEADFRKLLSTFEKLSDKGKDKLLSYAEWLLEKEK